MYVYNVPVIAAEGDLSWKQSRLYVNRMGHWEMGKSERAGIDAGVNGDVPHKLEN